MKISYSAFDTFNRCPLQYKLSYIEHIRVPEKPELYFGGLIHEIVQFALKKDPIIPPVTELTTMLKNRWREEIFPSKDSAKQYFDFGVDMLKKFHSGFQPGLRNIVAVEKRFQIPLNEKHILSGVIDRIDKLPFGAFEVIDYKTSKSLPTQSEVDRDKQLGLYNLAVENLWPEAKDIRLTLYYLKHDSQITTKRRPDEVEDVKTEVIDTAETIEKEQEFTPRLNPLCDWCDYQNRCPLQKYKFQDKQKEIDAEIEEYILAHKKISELEPKIHQHFDDAKIERYFHKNGVVSRSKTGKISIRKK